MKRLYNLFFLLFLAFPKLALAIDPPTITASSQLCAPGGGTVTLTANSVAGATIKWFDAQFNGNELGGTSIFITPVLTSNTTYYAEATSGNETSIRQAYQVVVNAPPTASFTAPAAISCASQSYSFINNSTGNNLTYLWDFGNPSSGTSNSSTLQNPSHTFIPNSGIGTQQFIVKLTVTDSVTGCSNTTTKTVIVQQAPDASFNLNSANAFITNEGVFINCEATAASPTFDFQISNGSTTIASNTNYTINWGDGNSNNLGSTFTSISHTYNTLGFFNITLSVQNSITGCTSLKYTNSSTVTLLVEI